MPPAITTWATVHVGARRRCIAEPGLTWCWTWPSRDVDLVPRQVRVAEHHDVGVGEPSSQPGGATGGGAAVVDHCQRAAGDLDADALGEIEIHVVVPLDGMDTPLGDVLQQRCENRPVDDVTGVEDDVGHRQLIADAIDQPLRCAGPEVGVGDEQDVGDGHRRSVVDGEVELRAQVARVHVR